MVMKKQVFHTNPSMTKNIKAPSILGIIIIFVIFSLTIPQIQAETIETDIGLPLYPGSKEIPDYIPVRTGQNHSSFQNITFITSDSFKKVLAFYQERLGKFSTSKPQTSAKSALWSESTAKGYRIVTLIEAEEGTKITITARTW
ncbi:MAG: hypothetical protein KBH86_01485 [Syntrophorhabdus sp.]|jgi:hypothetical protein|nr:hypothetical protein [Syntrophorhabdus sp.]MDI9556829.1 hypothetical protein [Pseudomonadota bacterium]HOD79055.1 hypothetical protein [Syntrophorhabdus sp.]